MNGTALRIILGIYPHGTIGAQLSIRIFASNEPERSSSNIDQRPSLALIEPDRGCGVAPAVYSGRGSESTLGRGRHGVLPESWPGASTQYCQRRVSGAGLSPLCRNSRDSVPVGPHNDYPILPPAEYRLAAGIDSQCLPAGQSLF